MTAYAFVQQAQNSVASQTTPLTAPATGTITTTSGDALVIVIIGTTGATITLSDGAIGNTYTSAPVTGAVHSGTHQMYLFYAQNINGGATAITATASPGALDGIYVAEYSGLATTGLLIGSIGNNQNGPGSTANSVTSGSITNSVSAMLFGFTYPDNGAITSLPTAGTSPIAFTGRTGVWATFNGNSTAVGTPEDAAISGSAAATFGSAAGALQFDNFLTVAAAFALGGAASNSASIAWIT